jgi:uncharacterized protein YdaU (DUF1376 family)
MNFYDRHIGDYLKNTLSLSMLEDGAYNRLLDYYYSEELPLPKNIKEIYKISRANSKKERDAVDVILNKFFTLFDDGYRQKRCDEVIDKFYENKPKSDEKKANARDRQKRARERRHELFEELRGYGITAPWNTTTAELEAALSNAKGGKDNAAVTPPVTTPVTRDITATNTHSPFPIPHINTSSQDLEVTGEETGNRDDDPESDKFKPGKAAAALIKLGVQVTGQHPTLLAWVKDGFTLKQMEEAVSIARLYKIAPAPIAANYLDPILREPPKARNKRPEAWWTSEAKILAKAKEMNVPTKSGEMWPEFKARIQLAIDKANSDPVKSEVTA